MFAGEDLLGASPLCWIWAQGGRAAALRAQFGHQQCYLLVFCILPITDCIKRLGYFPDPDVPPPVPCKKRSIQHRELCRCRCSRVALRRSTSFWGPTWREACLFVSTRPVCDPNRRSKATVGLIRCARCVCICPGLLKTPKNARCSPGDPCSQRKPCPCRYPHRLFAALTFLNAGLELVNLPPVWLRRGGA